MNVTQSGVFTQGQVTVLNLTTSLKNDGRSCSAANQCSGGFCNSNVCASTAASTTTTGGSGGGGGGGGSGTALPTEETPPAPQPPEGVPVVGQEPSTVTDQQTISQIVSSLSPGDLGVSQINPENLDIKKTGEATATETVTLGDIEVALAAVSDPDTKKKLQEVKDAIQDGSAKPVSISKKLEVFTVTEKNTGKTITVSKIQITFTAENSGDVVIIEIIPKTTASDIFEIKFSSQPTILQADPVVEWSFANIRQGETREVSYTVNKNLSVLETDTIGAVTLQAGQPPALIGEKDYTTLYAFIFIIAIIAVAYFAMHKKKRSRHHRMRHIHHERRRRYS